MGDRAKTTYAIGSVAFVPHPVQRGMWMRTDLAVLLADCERCKSRAGIPCRSHTGSYISSTHWVRRNVAAEQQKTKPRRVIVREIVFEDRAADRVEVQGEGSLTGPSASVHA
jgi:hypothetical protein